MPPVGFEPTTPAGERPQTYALERAATGTGRKVTEKLKRIIKFEYQKGFDKKKKKVKLYETEITVSWQQGTCSIQTFCSFS